MKLPRILRRFLWMWAFIALFFIVCFATLYFTEDVMQPVPSDEGDLMISLLNPEGKEAVLLVDVADTPDERRRGLQNRPVVERGMLFVFDTDEMLSFWMKDTLVPLDIAYFTSSGVWVSSARMEPCVTEECPMYPSAGPARFALELPVDMLGATVGSGWTLDVRGAF